MFRTFKSLIEIMVLSKAVKYTKVNVKRYTKAGPIK